MINKDDVENFFSKKYGSILKPAFDLWLRTTGKLEIRMKRTVGGYVVKIENPDMKLPLQIVTESGKQTIRVNKKITLVNVRLYR